MNESVISSSRLLIIAGKKAVIRPVAVHVRFTLDGVFMLAWKHPLVHRKSVPC